MEKKFAKTIDSILSEKGCPKINLQIRGSNEQTRCSKKHLDTSRKRLGLAERIDSSSRAFSPWPNTRYIRQGETGCSIR